MHKGIYLRKVSFLVLLILSVAQVQATRQIADLINVDGIHYPINELPLSQYQSDPIPSDPKILMCTASHRGYQATWQLKDGYLWLESIKLDPCKSHAEYLDLKSVFKVDTDPVKAKWYTGQISVSRFSAVPASPAKDNQGRIFMFKEGQLIARKNATTIKH